MELLEKAKGAFGGLQSWGRLALLNPAQFLHDPPMYAMASRAKGLAYDLGEALLLEASKLRRMLAEGNEVAAEVVEWVWKVHRLAIEWGLPVKGEAVGLLRKLRKEAVK